MSYKEKNETRGGGVNGSMKRGKSKGFAKTTGDLLPFTVDTAAGRGSTKAIEPSKERSESWQQDMEHAIIPGMSCPQSM